MDPRKIRKILFLYTRFVEQLVNVTGLMGAFILFIISLLTFYEVLMRYFFKAPTTWSIDYSIYLIMWGTFLGAAFTLKAGSHIYVDIILMRFPEKMRKIITVGIYCLIIIFCLILAWRGFVSCLNAYQYKEITLSYTRTPLYIPLLSIPIGAVLMVLETVREIIQSFNPGRSWG